MFKKVQMSLVFNDLVVAKTFNANHRMHNLYANIAKILDASKIFSNNLVNEQGNCPCCGVAPSFNDLEEITLNLPTEKHEHIKQKLSVRKMMVEHLHH